MNECPSRLVLAQFHVDEIDGAQRERLFNHVEQCDRCQETLARLNKNVSHYDSRREAHALSLQAAIAAETERQSNVVPLSLHRKLVMGAAVFATAAAIIFGIVFFNSINRHASTDDIGYKGTFAVSIVAKRGNRQFAVSDGTVLMENDALRFQVQTSKKGYLYIFNIDNAGAVTALYPFNDRGSSISAMKISTPGNHTMAGSIVLDDARGTEYMVALFSESAFETGIISDLLAKQVVRSNKKNGDISKMLRTELSESVASLEASLIAIEKK